MSSEGRSEDNNNNNNNKLICRICKKEITSANLGYVIYRPLISKSGDRIFHSICYDQLNEILGRDLLLADIEFQIEQGNDIEQWVMDEHERLKKKIWGEVEVSEIK